MIKPLLSIVVCTYNREMLLQEMLRSLVCQSLSPRLYEIIIVDNASTDGTAKFVSDSQLTYKNIRYVLEKRLGLSFARNCGWSEAVGEYVAYIDDDALADYYWAERICEAFSAVTPQPDAIGGRILPWYRNPPPRWFDDSFETRSWGESSRFLDPEREIFGFSGSNMVIKREILVNYKGFSTAYGMEGEEMRFGEESELFMRLTLAGRKLYYVPDMIVHHAVNACHYTYRYIAKRSFNSGVTHFSMDRIASRSNNAIAVICKIIVSFVHMPVFFITGGNMRLVLAMKIRRMSHLFGYLVGICSKTH